MSEDLNENGVNQNLESSSNHFKLNNDLINETNNLNINDPNEDLSDYESCGEAVSEPIGENDIATDDELASHLESELSEQEFNSRKLESIDLKTEGNKLFKEGLYEQSVNFYTKALRLCPTKYAQERAVMYGNRSAARIHLNQKDDAIQDCNKAIQLNPNYVKALLRRAQLYRDNKEKLDESLADYNRVLELDPKCNEAIVASNQLKIEINERNEKMKTEMLAKLKDLGNLVLRPFGLSTDNFKLTQNAETGGYSVNFQNN